MLLDSSSWAFVTLAAVPFTYASNTWYVLRFEWAANGSATVHLLDETRTTTLASTPTVATNFVTPGGIAMRGFTTTAGTVFHDVDTIQIAPIAQVYGAGCGVPVPLALNGTAPVLGTSWGFTTTNIDPVSPVAVTFFGLTQTALPLDPLGAVGCFALVDTLLASATIPSIAGVATNANPYPSTNLVSGMSGWITNMTLTFSRLSHSRIQDVNMLLVSPTGVGIVLFAEISGQNRACTNVTVNLADGLTYPLPPDFDLWSERLTPQDFQDRLLSYKGAAFGLEPELLQSAWFRPHNRSEEIGGLYCVGQSFQPGGGTPSVMMSAKMTAREIAADLGLNEPAAAAVPQQG